MAMATDSATEKRRHAKNRHSAEEWNQQKALIEKLYIDEDRTVEDTMQILKDQEGFVAGERKFKMQLKDWGFEKNIRSSIMQIMLAKATKRKFADDKDTKFRYKGRDILPDRLDHFAKRSHVKNGKRVSPTACKFGTLCYHPKKLTCSPATPSFLSYCTMHSNRSSFSGALVRSVSMNKSTASIASTVSSVRQRSRTLRRSFSNLSSRAFSAFNRGNSPDSDHRSTSLMEFDDVVLSFISSQKRPDQQHYNPEITYLADVMNAKVIHGCQSCQTLVATTVKQLFTTLCYHILHSHRSKIREAAEEILVKVSPLCRPCRTISYEFILVVIIDVTSNGIPAGGLPELTDLYEKLLRICVEDHLYECSYIAFNLATRLAFCYLDQGLLYEMEQKLLETCTENEGVPRLAWFCNRFMLARIYSFQERHQDAIKEFWNLSKSGIEVFGFHSSFMQQMVWSCAEESEKLHDFKTSIDLFQRLLMEQDPTDYVMYYRTILALIGLSNSYRGARSVQNCKKYAYQAAEVLRSCRPPLANEPILILCYQTECHLNLAVSFDRENNHEQAESYFSQVITGYEKMKIKAHPSSATQIILVLQQHYYERPRRIDVLEATITSSHPSQLYEAASGHPTALQSILVTVIQQADGLSRLRNYQRAEYVFNEARGLLTSCSPRLRLFFTVQIAQHHRRKEEWKHVRRYLEQVVTLSEEIYGPSHVCTAAFKRHLCAFNEEMGNEGRSIAATARSLSLLTLSSMSTKSTGSNEVDELDFLEDGMVWGQPPASLLRFA